jgi:hypothetical protein
MEKALRDYLLADTAITAVIDDRVHYVQRPQGGALPALVLTVISSVPAYEYTGAAPLVAARVQIDAYAAKYDAAKELARLVVARLGGQRVLQSDVNMRFFKVDERDDRGEAQTAGVAVFRVSTDYQVWHDGD